jgi:hypothetical protein
MKPAVILYSYHPKFRKYPRCQDGLSKIIGQVDPGHPKRPVAEHIFSGFVTGGCTVKPLYE